MTHLNIDPVPDGRTPVISTGFTPVSLAVAFFFFQFRTQTVLAFRISDLQNSSHKLIFSAWPVIRNPPNKFGALESFTPRGKRTKERKMLFSRCCLQVISMLLSCVFYVTIRHTALASFYRFREQNYWIPIFLIFLDRYEVFTEHWDPLYKFSPGMQITREWRLPVLMKIGQIICLWKT